jgi:hypothetical protein
MSNADVSPSTLDFVGTPAADPASGDGPGPEGTHPAASLHGWSGVGYVIEKVLYVGLAAGFIALIYGLSTLLHF